MGLFDGLQFNPQNYGGDLQGLLSRLLPQSQVGATPTNGFPQQDSAALPANSQPTQGLIPQTAPQQSQSLLSQEPGFGDRLLAGLGGFQQGGKGGGLIGALTGGLNGAITGQRNDPQYLAQQTQKATFQSLVDSGMPKNIAMAATLNPEILKQIAPQYFAKPQLQETGTDPLTGKKTFAQYDPTAGTLTPIGGNQATQSQGGGSMDTLQKAVQAGVTGEELYKHLPSGMAGSIKAMIEGRQPMPSTQAMRSPAILAMIDAAHTIDPTFDATSWQQRVAGQKDFYGGGKSAEMTRAANQTLHHVGQLIDSMDKLDNGSFPMKNAVGNYLSEATGGGAPGAFRTNAHAVAEEMSKVFKGANLSDAEIRSWESNLNANMSPEQQRAQVGKLRDLLQGSLHALEEKRLSSIGPMAAAKAGPLIQEEGQKVLQKLDDWVSRGPQKSSAAPAVVEGATATNPQTGAKITFKNGKWQ